MIRILPLLLCFFVPLSQAQQTAPGWVMTNSVTDAVLKATAPSAATIHANVERTVAGKKESGTLTLKVAADGSNSEAWNMSSGRTYFQAGPLSGARECSRTDSAGVKTTEQDLSCMRPVPWFAPWAGARLSNAGLLNTRAAEGEGNSGRVFIFATALVPTGKKRVQQPSHDLDDATSVTVSYDPTTNLPIRSTYNVPAGLYGSSIQIEVEYSDYRDEAGFMLPHHLVRHVQHTRDLDVQVFSITID